jgi:hypothetical protein
MSSFVEMFLVDQPNINLDTPRTAPREGGPAPGQRSHGHYLLSKWVNGGGRDKLVVKTIHQFSNQIDLAQIVVFPHNHNVPAQGRLRPFKSPHTTSPSNIGVNDIPNVARRKIRVAHMTK